MFLEVTLNRKQYDRFMRPVNMPRERMGGFQRLLDDLHPSVTPLAVGKWKLRLSVNQARRVVMYSHPKYGGGTYQEQFRAIEKVVAESLARYDAEFPPLASLFDEDEEAA